ncbi:MAG TPA: hypothetical protein VEK08_07665, partial [Planctomycetota bacterium]|nr:hypothetical protein [Planctomycetota bacterium]
MLSRYVFLFAQVSGYLVAAEATEPNPPIPIRFTLQKPSFVTLVIEDAAGRRVRNLVSETRFEAGEQVVWWDGLDETPGNFRGPIYEIQGKPIEPGSYRVRGLAREALSLKYEFTVYNAGQPPWRTGKGQAGEWLADHSPPSSVLFVPGDDKNPEAQILIGSQVAEQGDGLVWTDLNGRKLKGAHGVGGAWTGAHFLTRDEGPARDADIYAYTCSTWKSNDPKKSELRLLGLSRTKAPQVIIPYTFDRDAARELHGWDTEYNYVGGVAAFNGIIVVTLPSLGKMLIVDAKAKKLISEIAGSDATGVAFDRSGRLLAIANNRVVRHDSRDWHAPVQTLPPAPVLISAGLDEPRQIASDASGTLYISDRGRSHCVKVFSADGALLRTIGKPGVPSAGVYDPRRMSNPNGLTLTSDGHVWVAEDDHAPKRVSIWTRDGVFVRALYGPSRYGGGGNLSTDKKRFYYYDAKNGSGGGMEFSLDWDGGKSELSSIYK